MRKFCISVVLASQLFIPIAVYADSPNVSIDGVMQVYDQSPVIVNDFTLVPLRGIFESLGASVQWDDKAKKVTATKDNTVITLVNNSNTGFVNGLPVPLDIPARIMNDRMMVPLRFVSESFGASVKWDQSTKTVVIQTSPTAASNKQQEESQSPSNNRDALTYNEALDLAFKHNNRLKTAKADIDRAFELRQKAAEDVKFIPSGQGSGASDAALRNAFTASVQADLNYQMATKSLEVTQDQVSYSVRRAYNEVLQAIEKKKIAELAVQHANWQARLANVRFQSGAISKFDMSQATNSLTEAKERQQAAVKAVEDAYQKLNHQIGLPSNSRYELHEQPAYSVLDSDVDTHVTRTLSGSISVWLAEQNVNLAKLNLDLHVFNVGGTPYEAKKIDVEKAEISASDVRRQLESSVRNLYFSIKQLETQYNLLQASLSKAEDAYYLTKARYEAGMAIEADFISAKLNMEQIKQQVFDLVAQLDLMKIAYEKPWALN